MNQTILIDNDANTKNLFTSSLDTIAGTKITQHANATELITVLKNFKKVSLIITRVKIGDENTAQILYDFIRDEALPVSIIVLGECEELKDDVHCLKDPINLDDLVHLVTDHLSVNAEAPKSQDFEPIGLHYFYNIPWAPCDIFIRIKKDEAQYKYYKRINSNETFDRLSLDKYHTQGLTEFFVHRDDKHLLMNFVSKELTEKLKRKDLSTEEMLNITSSTRDIVREIVQKSGLDTASIQLSKAFVDSMEETLNMTSNSHQIVKEVIQQSGLNASAIELSTASVNTIVTSVIYSPEMSGLLKILLSDKISYAYQMCHLQSLMCHYILTKQSWYKSWHLEALSFASFFTDVTLQTQEQMEIGSMIQLYASKLTDHEKQLVLNHPKAALLAIESHPLATSYVRTVMTEACGKSDGIGIEENPTENLHVLSKIFIIADNFVKILLNPNMPSTKKEILPLLYERFSNPSYQKIIKTLEQKFQ